MTPDNFSPSVSHEHQHRALDRLAVHQARLQHRPARLLWLLIGPGILVMLGENDAPSMLSYAATGSQFGIGFFLPFVLLTFAMAFVAQEITVRLGAASQAGHAELIYRRFGRFWGNFAMIDLLFTNFLTLVTEFVGIVAGAGYFGDTGLGCGLMRHCCGQYGRDCTALLVVGAFCADPCPLQFGIYPGGYLKPSQLGSGRSIVFNLASFGWGF